MMMDEILAILLISAVIWYWWDTQQCNEIALHACRRRCAIAACQLLDATVIRQRTWLRRGPSAGLQICRLYSFDYYDNHTATDFGQRQQGYIVLLGKQVIEIDMPVSWQGQH